MNGPEGDGRAGARDGGRARARTHGTAAVDPAAPVSVREPGVAGDGGQVLVEYTAEVGDMAEAARLVQSTHRGLTGFLYRPGVAVVLLVLGAALAVVRIAGGNVSLAVVWPLLLLGLLPFYQRRTAARASVKSLARQGRTQAVVHTGGVRRRSAVGEETTVWSAFGGWLEGKRVFVLISPGSVGRCACVLPKAGVVGPDGADRLRALLTAHLPRR